MPSAYADARRNGSIRPEGGAFELNVDLSLTRSTGFPIRPLEVRYGAFGLIGFIVTTPHRLASLATSPQRGEEPKLD
jgi:hypothetical protein